MKIRTKILLTLAASTQLSGCFFVFIPGSVVDKGADMLTGQRGDHCVAAGARVGDHLSIAGKNYTIMVLEGTSRRCQNPTYPMRAVLRHDPDVAQ